MAELVPRHNTRFFLGTTEACAKRKKILPYLHANFAMGEMKTNNILGNNS